MAYDVSEQFKTAIKDGYSPQKIIMQFADFHQTPVLFENKDIVSGSVQIEQYFSSGEELKYGECPSDTLSFSLFNPKRILSGFPFGDCRVSIGVQISEEDFTLPSDEIVHSEIRNGDIVTVYAIKASGFYCNGTLVRAGTFTSILVNYPEVFVYTSDRTVLKFVDYGDGDLNFDSEKPVTPFEAANRSTPRAEIITNFDDTSIRKNAIFCDEWENGVHKRYELSYVGDFVVNRPVNTMTETIEFQDCYSAITVTDADASEVIKYLEEILPDPIVPSEYKTLNNIVFYILRGSLDSISIEPSDNPYAEVVYTQNPFPLNNTYTKRELLAFIAERLRSVVRLSGSGLHFAELSSAVTETITSSDIAQGSFEAWDVPIELTTGVLLKQEDVSLLFGDGENPYYIYGNPLITTITNDDLSAYKGLPTYYPCSFTVINADPSIEVGDLIDIKSLINEYILIANNNEEVYADENDVAYAIRKSVSTIPLLQRTLTFNGHCSAEYRAVGRMKHELPDSAATNAALSMTGVGSMDQKRVFDILTNGGIDQGIYLQDGKIYVNGEYIKANSISADLISGGTIRSSNIDVPGSTTDDGKITVYYSQEYSTSTFSISSILKPGMLVNRGETSYDSGTSSWEEVDVRYDLIQFVTGTDTTREDLSYYGQTSAYIVDSNGFSVTILPDTGLSFSDSSGAVLAKYRTSQVQLAHVSPTTTEQSVALLEDIYDFNALCFHLNVGGYNSVMYLPKAAFQNTGHLCLEVIYNLTQYYLFVDVWFISSSVIKYAVRSVGPNWGSTTKYLYIYGI